MAINRNFGGGLSSPNLLRNINGDGDTDVKVCNKALLLLGAEPITSFSDGSASAQACDTIYKEVKFFHDGNV